MFCTKCGASISNHDRFCPKCGTARNSTLSAITVPPVSGTPVYRGWGPVRVKSSYPLGYEWLSERNTFLLCKDHIILIKGADKRSSFLDGWGVTPTPIAVAGVIRAAKDAIVNRNINLASDTIEGLFNNRQLIWCKNCDAEFWQYDLKPWMFIKKSYAQIYCRFNSMVGKIHCCIVLCETQFVETFKDKDFGSHFKKVVVERNVPELEVEKIMKESRLKLLPD